MDGVEIVSQRLQIETPCMHICQAVWQGYRLYGPAEGRVPCLWDLSVHVLRGAGADAD